MSHQDADHATVQLHRAILAAGGLGPAEGSAEVLATAVRARRLCAAERDQLLTHNQNAAREVDVGPAQAHGLAAA